MCGVILLSHGLQEVFRNILAIGNIMNKGTWKGDAFGFRLSSLSKLHQTKSSDGKSTVLDYLIQMLHTRVEGGDTSGLAALNIDCELSLLSRCKSIVLSELYNEIGTLEKDLKATRSIVERTVVPLIAMKLNDAESHLRQLMRALDQTKDKGKYSIYFSFFEDFYY